MPRNEHAGGQPLIRRYMAPLKATLVLVDGLSAVVLFLILARLRFDVLGGTWSLAATPVQLALAYAGLWVAALWLLGLYRLRAHWALRGDILDVLRATIVAAAAAFAVLFLFDLRDVSRVFVVMLLVAQPTVTITLRVVLRRVLESLRSRGRMTRFMLVVGTGQEAEAFANGVERYPSLGLRVIGHLDVPGGEPAVISRQIIGSIEDIESILHSRVVDEVAVCLRPSELSYVEPVTRICEEEGRVVRVSMSSLGGLLTGGQYEEVGGLPIATYLYGPDRFLGMLGKRIFDIVASVALLLLLSPFLALIALYIRIADGPPLIFRQDRVGLHGRPFTLLKFRTMVTDAEELLPDLAHLSEVQGPAFKIAEDPRITRPGRFLRRTSLDELPQLWNVLRGEMSIVGPRPAPQREVDRYSIWHRRRLSMRPGLTGLWQVSARSETEFDRRVELDLDYIDRWSLWMDFKILLRTIPVVVGQEGR